MILLPSRICFRFSPTYASFISISSAIVYHCNRLLSIKHSSLARTALLTREAQVLTIYRFVLKVCVGSGQQASRFQSYNFNWRDSLPRDC